MSQDGATCSTCLFFRPKGQKCRRYPPQTVFNITEMKREAAYPQVNMGMWCGEHQPAPASPAPAAPYLGAQGV